MNKSKSVPTYSEHLIGGFVTECVEAVPNKLVPVDAMYSAFVAWCEARDGTLPTSVKMFARVVALNGFRSEPRGRVRAFVGACLRSEGAAR